MIFKKIILIIISLISLISSENDFKRYEKLKIKDVPSIEKSNLPQEFSDESFEVVDEFIRKTIGLNYEILLYFDYVTGEILQCKIGDKTTVEIKFDDNEFDGKHIASIHNHTKEMYTPPSDKNFGIFLREWEKYELIAAHNCLWILKGKLKDKKLNFELKTNSQILFTMVLDHCSKRYKNNEKRNDKIDEEYGKLLSNYINNNIKEIQIQKMEYNHDN